MKIAYLGIDMLYPVLISLLGSDCEILKIFTCPTDNVTEYNTRVIQSAENYRIPYTVQRITKTDMKMLSEKGCVLLICAGYYYRIPVTKAFPMVNFHPSPLPLGRGPWPMPWIILKGLAQGGITAHKIVEELDAGDILLQETFAVDSDETLVTYMDKVSEKIPGMVERLLKDLSKLWENARPQGQGIYWDSPTPDQWTVKARMPVTEADRILRAFYGYECIYEKEGHLTELIGGRAIFGGDGRHEFSLRGGYIEAQKKRKLELPRKMGTETQGETEEITLAHRQPIERLRAGCGHVLSSHAFQSLFLWRRHMGLSLYLTPEMFCVCYGKKGNNTWFFPCGEEGAVRAFIEKHIDEADFSLCYLRPEDADWLVSCYPGRWKLYRTPEDDEYLYVPEKHRCLKGRAYQRFRTQVNKVEREDAPRCAWLDDYNVQDALYVVREWHRTHEKGAGQFMGDEIDEEAVLLWRRLGLKARLLYLGGRPAAVTAGFYISEHIFDIAVAKTAVSCPGVAYYARRDLICSVPCGLINHEEDMGVPGLRKMKEGMLPDGKNEMWAAKNRT